MKVIDHVLFHCPMCSKKHNVEVCEDYVKSKFNNEEVTYKEIFYRCPDTPPDAYYGNSYYPGGILDENLKSCREAYLDKVGAPNISEVAKYILHSVGEITPLKLQKLCYYSYVWNLIWLKEKLFYEKIYALENGPVIKDLSKEYKDLSMVKENDIKEANANRMSDNFKKTIDKVLEKYGSYTGNELSQLTHKEAPWQKAREREDDIIDDCDIINYYSDITL